MKHPKVNVIPTPVENEDVVNVTSDSLVRLSRASAGEIIDDRFEPVLEIRDNGGHLNGKSIFLSCSYNWQLVMDGSSVVLLPTKKR